MLVILFTGLKQITFSKNILDNFNSYKLYAIKAKNIIYNNEYFYYFYNIFPYLKITVHLKKRLNCESIKYGLN